MVERRPARVIHDDVTRRGLGPRTGATVHVERRPPGPAVVQGRPEGPRRPLVAELGAPALGRQRRGAGGRRSGEARGPPPAAPAEARDDPRDGAQVGRPPRPRAFGPRRRRAHRARREAVVGPEEVVAPVGPRDARVDGAVRRVRRRERRVPRPLARPPAVARPTAPFVGGGGVEEVAGEPEGKSRDVGGPPWRPGARRGADRRPVDASQGRLPGGLGPRLVVELNLGPGASRRECALS